MGFFSSDIDVSDHIDATPQGEFVTEDRVRKVDDLLEEGERVHYMIAGGTIDAEGSGAGESIYGSDRARKHGTKGFVRTVFTDDRVAIKIPQFLGNDQRIIPYNNISSVDLDTGLLHKRMSLQTKGHTYHIEADKPGKAECREIASFVREKMRELQEGPSESDENPTEQLQTLKELFDDGVLDEEEFKEKKEEILDRI